MYDDRTSPLQTERTLPTDTTRALLLHDLASMYDAELHLLDVLPLLAAETAPGDVSNAFMAHAGETELHASNLRKCFRMLDVAPMTVTNFGIRGLTRDHDEFVALGPSRDALLAFNLGAAAKTEHLEIASYIGLLRQVHALGLRDMALLLAENLRVEQKTASSIGQLADEAARTQAYASGAQIEEFRWSAYTDVVGEMPRTRDELMRDDMHASIRPDDGLTPRVPIDLGGSHAR